MPFPDKSKVSRYYRLHDRIETAMRRSDYSTVAQCAVESVPLVPDLVGETKKEHGTFDITESVAVHAGGRVLAALGHKADLAEMHRVLSSMPETQEWAKQVSLLIEDASLVNRVLTHVRSCPGTVQAGLKDVLGNPDARRLSNVCYWLTKVGRLKRERRGNSYALSISEMV